MFQRCGEETCGDAVEVSGHEVTDSSSLELKGTGAVNGRNGGVGLLHPVHQPLDLTVTVERVPTQIAERRNRDHMSLQPQPPTWSQRTSSWSPHTYRSVRMSRCLKSSLGSCCRLLFDSDLEKERWDSGEFLKTAGR